MRHRDFFFRQFVDRCREPFRKPPAIDEDHCRAMFANELDQSRMNRWPDGRNGWARRSGSGGRRLRSEFRHVLDGNFNGEVKLPFATGFNDLDMPRFRDRVRLRKINFRAAE